MSKGIDQEQIEPIEFDTDATICDYSGNPLCKPNDEPEPGYQWALMFTDTGHEWVLISVDLD